MKHIFFSLGTTLAIAFLALGCASNGNSAKESISADDAIKGVSVIGTIGMDGSKPHALVVEYGIDLTGAKIDADTFDVYDYGLSLSQDELNAGSNAGVPTKIYLNDKPALSDNGGSKDGHFVIIEVNTDYSVGRYARSYLATMAAGVMQKKQIATKTAIITPSTKQIGNYYDYEYIGLDPQTGGTREAEYYLYANEGTYTIPEIAFYELHLTTHDREKLNLEGAKDAFNATHCFDEANGKYWDFELPYALYVPADYDANKKYALVLHLHDAGSMDSNPLLTICESQGAANYASDYFRDLLRAEGLDGAIVVCPAISEDFYMNEENPHYNLRIARDNWTLSCGAQAVLQLLDSITEQYNIDTNRIYGSGQSMGGMTVMALAAERDNYFAALLPLSCKWGTNFKKEEIFGGARSYNAEADGNLIWKQDSDGNDVDYNNWFYLISDDNILYYSTAGENTEYSVLFHDLCGVNVESAEMYLDENTNVEKRNQIVRELVKRENPLGIYQVNLSGNVGHMSAWFYGHSTTATLEWLATQTRESEMTRAKLDLNKPFELADEQNQDDTHIWQKKRDGTALYIPTGKQGSGTLGYNSGCTVLGSDEVLLPGR